MPADWSDMPDDQKIEYLQGKVIALERICAAFLIYVSDNLTDIPDIVELRTTMAFQIRNIVQTEFDIRYSDGITPFGQGIRDGFLEYASKLLSE